MRPLSYWIVRAMLRLAKKRCHSIAGGHRKPIAIWGGQSYGEGHEDMFAERAPSAYGASGLLTMCRTKKRGDRQ
jgi:hypothetical protein